MENITNILLGFQIGFLLSALWYARKIKRLQNTPTLPYNIAMTAIYFMVFWRIERIFNFFPDLIDTIATTTVAILWMIFFISIYTLIKGKNI